MVGQKGSFGLSLEVHLAVAGMDFVEQAEIVGDCCGKRTVSSGRKRDASAGSFFPLKKFKNLRPIGKTSRVELDPGGELAFEVGSS
jgi:hypothetical protein